MENDDVVDIPKKRGRPKKESTSTELKNSSLLQKKIGRPKKENITSYQLKNSSLSKCYKCNYCGSYLFFEESSRAMWCCGKGRIKIKFPTLDAPFYDNPKFLSETRSYYNLFSFSALGVTGGFQSPKSGPSLVKIQGRIYHRIFDLSYTNSVNNSSLYVSDGKERQKISLQYPLLFPHASAGWSVDLCDDQNKKISQTKYYRYLLLSEPRFTRLARLGQEYFVDMWCRTEEEKLQFIRYNQSKFLCVASRRGPLRWHPQVRIES